MIDNDARARRWIAICIAVSIMLHLALLLIPLTQRMGEPPASSRPVQGPLTVRLANQVARTPPVAVREPHQVLKPRPALRRPPIIAMRRSTSPSAKVFTVPAPAPMPLEPSVQPDQQMDMTAMLEARRAARGALEAQAAQENAAAAASGEPSANDRIMANINRNKNMASKSDGTGGMFEVTSRGVRMGEFKFNGWHPGGADNWHETYTVDAGEQGNVDLAIVKKVIEVIRKYKTGDFDFESRRLGRSVTMSARPADNARLEDFLMKELFGDNSPTRSR